jgi:hypothetical protein
MAKSTITIDLEIIQAYAAYCKKNGLILHKKIEKLMILDLYKAGYDVTGLIKINNDIDKIKELKKRVVIEPVKFEGNKPVKEESNGSM